MEVYRLERVDGIGEKKADGSAQLEKSRWKCTGGKKYMEVYILKKMAGTVDKKEEAAECIMQNTERMHK